MITIELEAGGEAFNALREAFADESMHKITLGIQGYRFQFKTNEDMWTPFLGNVFLRDTRDTLAAAQVTLDPQSGAWKYFEDGIDYWLWPPDPENTLAWRRSWGAFWNQPALVESKLHNGETSGEAMAIFPHEIAQKFAQAVSMHG